MNFEAPWPVATETKGGSVLVRELASLSLPERETQLEAWWGEGRLPQFLRTPVSLALTSPDARGREHTLTLQALPDYLAIGTDEDYVRVPMSPRLAQVLANRWKLVLPTPRLVDEIYAHAATRLDAHPLAYKHQKVESFEAVLEHEALVEAERRTKLAEAPVGALVAGHKKDIVLTTQLVRPEHQGRVAVYGWHGHGGKAQQGLSLVRSADYVEYAHAVRFLAPQCEVDGRPFALREVLQDAVLHKLVSDEGPVPATLAYPTRWQPMRTRRR